MSWIQLNVSVTNGSNVVTVNNGLSTAKVRIGDALILAGFQPVEIVGVYANSLTIASNWENSAQNGAMAAVMPTFGDFDNAAATMRQFTQTTQSNFAAMEAWWTQQNGTVTFKGQDGEEHQVRSAKQMDADVKDLQVETKNTTDAMVALLANGVSLSQADFHVPLNDSLQITRGFGTHDTIDVSAAQDGSVMVELPTKSVDFSCASQRNFFNKSGQKQIADIDHPAIDNSGVVFHQSYIAAAINSERILDSEIEGGGDSGWSYGAGTTVEPSINGSPKFYQQVYLLGESNNVPSPSVNFSDLGASMGDRITCSVYLRGTPGATCRLQVFSYSPTFAMPPVDVVMTSEFERHKLTFTVPDTSIYTYFKFQPVRLGMGNIKDGDIIQFHSPMINLGSFALPYIETKGSAVAVPATVATVPLMNNMPSPGKSFSISAVATVPNSRCGLFGFGMVAKEKLTIWRYDFGNDVAARISDGSTTISLTSLGIDTLKEHRYTLTYDSDSGVLNFYVGGVLADSTDASMIDFSQVYSLDDTANIGSVGNMGANTAPLNASMKDLRIYFKALSADEIAVLGE